jgi:dienelactone hydrolase
VTIAAASDTKDQPEVREHFKTRMKTRVNYEEAIRAFKELCDSFNVKYKPVCNSGYIEKSSEGNIIHIFIDYKDVAAYEKARSQYLSDQEFMDKWANVLKLYTDGTWKSTAYVSATSFRVEEPVSDLSQGQEGKIFFSSLNLGSFREILAGEGQSKPVTISGTLKIPKGVNREVPAVIILHGAGGVNAHYYEDADTLNQMGVAAFVVDSFESRGIHSGVGILKKLFHSYSTRISDAYAALELLSSHPKIDRDRIAVLGYSHGAKVALFVASEKIRRSFIADNLQFAASIAYYPNCALQLKNIDFTDAPVLILLAEKDNICPIEACLEYTRRMKESGADVKAIVYKGAHHMFPVLSSDKIRGEPSLPDWSNCKTDEYLFIREDGTCISPHKKKTFHEVNALSGDWLANCRIDGEAIVGGNEKAKIESIKEYQSFLRNVFNIN